MWLPDKTSWSLPKPFMSVLNVSGIDSIVLMSFTAPSRNGIFRATFRFLHKASFGLRVLSLPACVHVSINHELVCAITGQKLELESQNLDRKIQNILLEVPIVFGTDWAWPSRSNFTLLQNSVYLHRFCIFEIFVRHVCLTVPHPTWLRIHCLTTTCPPTG